MSAPAKKREIDEESKENEEMTSSNDSSDDNEMDTNDEQGTQIMVDFVGRIPEDPDFNGIKLLLQQLFLKAKVETSELANFIIERNYVGSVVKQGGDDDAEDEDDEENDINDVFGITTIINISQGQNQDCIKQLRKVLADYSSDYASDTTNALIKSILENDSAALGLIINERFVNIPADIAVPLLENLIADMKRAVNKKMPYDFQYYVLISKLYKPKNTPGKKKKRGVEEPELIWSNPEEEIFAEDAMCSFEFSVDKDSDTSAWADDDEEMVPHRRVMLFEATKLPSIIEKIKKELAH
ncbi:protein BCCIP homolog [Diachasma alloeum]|uniref:protein BCCIP homolog n=1 Tax=Diachasma alloeum TaxID=454923 RepID=UPI0007382B72|nr:protein BCCIP homolog [Diachasma alloeum]